MKRFVIVSCIALVFIMAAYCQSLKETKAPPTLAIAQIAQFFKAQSELNAAELALEKTNEYKAQQEKTQAFQKIVLAMSQVCGTEFQLALDGNNDPVCQDKPKLPASAVPQAKK